MTTPDAKQQTSRAENNGHAALPSVREICWAGGLLAALLVLFFSTPIFRHEILSPADLLLKSDPWRQAAPPDFEPANALLSDYVYEMRPYRVITIASLKAGRIPLWDPHNYAGTPFLGNGISGALYPLNLLVLFLPEATSILLSAMIRLFIAGLSAYTFGRLVGLSVLGAGMSSLGFVFSGFLIVWLLYPHADVAIWLPALFLAGEAIIRRPTIFRIIALAVIVWIQFLGGHPETSLHILSAVTMYVCWRAGMLFREESDWRCLAHRLAAFSGALILGTAGAAVQLVPLGENILGSAMLRERIALAPPFWFLPRPRLLAMVALACPYCFGSHLRGDLPLGVFIGVGNFNELNGGYVGLISLALVGIAIALGARRGIDLFFLILSGLAFCVAYAIPPVFNLVHALPLFRVSANTRSLLLLAFALSVLAGRGTDLLVAAPEARVRRIAKRALTILVGGMAGVAIVAGSFFLIAMSFRENILEQAKVRIVAKVPQGETFRQSPEYYLALLPRYYDRLMRLLVREGAGRVLLLGLTGLAISLVVSAGRSRRSFTWVLPGVLVLDLFSFGRNYNPSIPKELEYPSHGAINFLREQPGLFRVLALNGGLPPNTNVLYGLSEVRGYSPLETEAYHRFVAATGDYPQPIRHFRTLYFSNFASRLIDLLNVKYVMSERELHHQKLRLVWEGTSRVYENLSVMPRAFLVYRTQVFSDGSGLERALREPAFDPSEVVLFEREGPAISGPADPAPMVRISDYQPERVVVEVSSRYDAILVLADSWFPGWKAAIDGIPTKIFRGNLLLRAVPIPAGHHQVRFRYDPLSYRIGVIVSGLALVVAISLGLAGPFLRKWYSQRLL